MNFPSLDFFTAVSTVIGAITAIFGLWTLLKPVFKAIKNLGNLVIQADKHTKLIEEIAAELKPNDGNSMRDVVDRMEKDMVSFDSKMKTLIVYNNVAMYETDKEGNCLWVSKEWCRITGLLPNDAEGNGWVLSVHENEREKVYEEWRNAVEQSRDFYMKYRVGSENSGYVLVQGKANAIKNAKGSLVGFIGTIEPMPTPSNGSSKHLQQN